MVQINLLPPELRAQSMVGNPKVRKRVIAVGIIIILASVGMAWFNYLGSMEQTLSQYKKKRTHLTKQLAQVNQLKQDIKEKSKELEALEFVKDSRFRWGWLLEKINQSMPQQIWVESLAAGGNNMLVIKGKAPSLEATGVLIHELKQMADFEVVVLNQVKQVEGQPGLMEFQVTAQLIEGSG